MQDYKAVCKNSATDCSAKDVADGIFQMYLASDASEPVNVDSQVGPSACGLILPTARLSW